jgi:hypothetical protein
VGTSDEEEQDYADRNAQETAGEMYPGLGGERILDVGQGRQEK